MATPDISDRTVGRARRLRAEMTLPEVLIWRVLRQRPGGFKFRRQHPIGSYILDFFCRKAGLAVEVDGEVHNRAGMPAHDERRDAWLGSIGVAVLRIPARDVLGDLDAVIRHIVDLAAARVPLHHPAAPGGPPPRENLGEDF